MAATVRQCVVLVGGEGAPPGPTTRHAPKPLLTCGDRPFLAWLLREFVRFGVDDFVLLTGPLSEQMEAALPAIAAGLPKPVRITCARAPVRAGTGGALFHASEHLAERFLLCNGDSLLDFNLARLLADAVRDGDDVTGRMTLRRPDDASRHDTSRRGAVETDGDRVTAFRERPEPGQPAAINAGITLFNRRVLDAIEPECSLERDVMPSLAANGALRGTVGDGSFIDVGIPADLERAQTDLSARLHRRALFLDRDGVINIDHGWVGTRERFEWNDGARETIRAASDAGWHVFVVTNQSGIARGHYDEAQLAALHEWMTDEVRAAGGTIDDLRYCPYHPEGSVAAYRRASDWRKPAPGMLFDLMARWEVDPSRGVLIGDQPSDIAAAEAAGVAAHRYAGGDLLDFARPILG